VVLSALYAGAGQSHREAVPVVVAARLAYSFAGGGASEFAAPDQFTPRPPGALGLIDATSKAGWARAICCAQAANEEAATGSITIPSAVGR